MIAVKREPKALRHFNLLVLVSDAFMQAAIQPFVDNAISKTVNIPESLPFSDFKPICAEAYRLGLKGCTTYHPSPVTGAILSESKHSTSISHCCDMDQEAD